MLRMYVMDNPSKWEYYLHLVEFSYNNRYQASLKMSPFESLYGIKCSTSISGDKPTYRVVLGTKFLNEMEDHMVKIKHNLKETQHRKKVYANKNKTTREFKVGEHVVFKVKTNKRSLKLVSCTNLAAIFCGLFEILDIIGPIAYMFALLVSMNVHNVFHVSFINKYAHDPNHVIYWYLIQVDTDEDIHVSPVRILDKKYKMIWNRVIEMVKVQWTYYGPKDDT
jgi:hypothetical protein